MVRALILDSEQRSALAAIRSLGRRGIEIVAASCVARPIGGRSRYARKVIRYPDPTQSIAAFEVAIVAAARELKVDYVVPMTDTTTEILLGSTDLGAGIEILGPEYRSYTALSDKGNLLAIARQLGIPAPQTIAATTSEGILKAARELGFPLILKPSRSRFRKQGRIVATSVKIARTPGDLAELLPQLEWLGDLSCLVQEYVPGHGAGVFTVYGRDGALSWFQHRRIREKPPSGGVSVLCESIEVVDKLRVHAERLLDSVQWRGPAMIEFRVSPDGQCYLMEVNGRFWGSLQLAIDCGVDFPSLLLERGTTRSAATPEHYPAGRRLRWLLGDVDNLLIQMKSNDTSIGKARALVEFSSTFFDFGCKQEVLRWTDPLPGLLELRNWLAVLKS